MNRTRCKISRIVIVFNIIFISIKIPTIKISITFLSRFILRFTIPNMTDTTTMPYFICRFLGEVYFIPMRFSMFITRIRQVWQSIALWPVLLHRQHRIQFFKFLAVTISIFRSFVRYKGWITLSRFRFSFWGNSLFPSFHFQFYNVTSRVCISGSICNPLIKLWSV